MIIECHQPHKGHAYSFRSETYRLQNQMIKFKLEQMGLVVKVETVLSDFEVGIAKALLETFPEVSIKGCRFHYSQVGDVW